MRFDESHGGSVDSVRLTALAPDPARGERVRLRCRTLLIRRTRRVERTAAIGGFAWRVVAPIVVAGVCLVYAALFVATTLHLQGVFN
jgi:hypothetical protein